MKSMDKVAKLIDAICENFMNALMNRPWAPQMIQNDDKTMTLVTYCNQFVNGVATSLGYTSLSGMTADQICAFVMTSPEWTNITWDVAQSHANGGALVIACQSANPHGHVCIIRPGVPLPSGHFGHPAPRCANVGGSVFIDKDVAYAFQIEPAYYCLNSTITMEVIV